jgi:glucokinase
VASERILGLDIGGTKTAVIVGTRGGQVQQRTAFPSQTSRGFQPMFDDICREAERALAEHPDIDGIGVSIGGPMDPAAGVIMSPPHLPGWDDIPLGELLQRRFGRRVAVEHDAKAGALAEWMFGAGIGVQDLVFLTAGTGLGGGVISGGRLVRGAGGAAGECGHWRIAADGPLMFGKRGSWESFASGAGIAALAAERFPARFAQTTAADLATLVRAGDADARAVIGESARALGLGLALLVDLLAPELIVLGTLARHMRDIWLEPAIEVMRSEALPGSAARCRVVPCELGEAIGDVAALCALIYRERDGAL